ncbi:hypothetical protein JW906_03185 [bacterium]|nr:hypothetical protein [bacterium]
MVQSILRLFCLSALSVASLVFGQLQTATDSAVPEMEVVLSAFAEPSSVPLNRTLAYTIQIAWQGDLSRVEIGEVEEPVFANFEVEGTASANRTFGAAAGGRSEKEILYHLRPKTLGMAYVEPVGITWKDTGTGRTHQMKTRRIGVEVTDPVPDPEARRFPLPLLFLIPVLAGAGAVLFFLMQGRRKKQVLQQEVKPPLEESFLAELRGTVDLKTDKRREAFALLSRLFRKYLSQKFKIPALEATTSQLMGLLGPLGIEEKLLGKMETLFSTADVVKFSGQEASRADLESAYTVVESFLEERLSAAKKETEAQAAEPSKQKKSPRS